MAGADASAVWPLSSPVSVDLAARDPVEAETAACDLVERIGGIDDPRESRWVDYPLPVVLALCGGAVVAGMRSFTAIASWVSDVSADVLARLYDRCDHDFTPPKAPSKCTIWRVVTETDPGQADAAIGAWLLERARRGEQRDAASQPTLATGADSAAPSEFIVDGKTLRGTKDTDGNQTHLLAAMTATGLVTAQIEVGAKTN